MSTGWIELLGEALAGVYLAYGIFFLFVGGFVGVHVVAMLILAFLVSKDDEARPPRFPSLARGGRTWRWIVEIAYGLLNPVMYLVVLIPNTLPLSRYATARQILTATAWTLLLAIWAARLMGRPSTPARAERWRPWVVGLLVAGLATVAAHAVLDTLSATGSLTPPPSYGGILLLFLVPPLLFGPVYAIPALMLVRHLRTAIAPDRWARSGAPAFFAPPAVTWPLRVASAALVVLTLVTAAYRLSGADAERFVLDRREAIVQAAATYDIDPGVLAAIMYVTHRDQLSPFRFELERLAMSSWAADESFGPALNVSVGVMQIKPVTAAVACRILEETLSPESRGRGAPKHQIIAARMRDAWQLPAERLASLPAPIARPERRRLLVADLLNDRTNIATAAFLIALHQAQWEHANAAWSIRERPDIQATLYQLGFDRSHPHGAPRSNAFGTRVLEVYRQPWLRREFLPRSSGQSARALPSGSDARIDRGLERLQQ